MDMQTLSEHDRRDHPAADWTRIGMIVPSSNTVLEPVTARLLHGMDGTVSAHFARLKVLEISLSEASRDQFSRAPVLAAARQLVDAKCDVIAWNGTSASWLGLETDEALRAAIESETGIAATTTSLCFRDAYQALGVTRLGLITPYTDDVQSKIVANYEAMGLPVVAERHLGDKGNFSFAEYSGDLVADLVRAVAAHGPEAISVVCTNFRGADHAAALEAELGIPVLDSVAVTLWGCLRRAGVDTKPLAGNGRLFSL
ncbi:MAG: aspartate/glutamate racemase family protein [Pseudomonadota bacterium]